LTFAGGVAKTIYKLLAGALTFVGAVARRKIVPVTIYLDASPSAGVSFEGAPAEDVTLDASPSAGVVLDKL
jgi:hypothetical protein